ncbi:uncharacterized protein TrAFT101_007031 [Trichoderma asperellum]|uniref:uncharacterized protein n=1 Tax=Trichoderma asperellum TaxID=101201 RepID=UPI00332907AE|nr:hypothetical protein TrAFT101_007031 [Trichoderma asperellum]
MMSPTLEEILPRPCKIKTKDGGISVSNMNALQTTIRLIQQIEKSRWAIWPLR